MNLEEYSIPQVLESTFPWIRHIHAAKNNRVEPGPGHLDLTSGFKVLKDLQYEGWIEVECLTLSGPAEESLTSS